MVISLLSMPTFREYLRYQRIVSWIILLVSIAIRIRLYCLGLSPQWYALPELPCLDEWEEDDVVVRCSSWSSSSGVAGGGLPSESSVPSVVTSVATSVMTPEVTSEVTSLVTSAVPSVEIIGREELVYPESLVTSFDGKHMFASLGDGRIVEIRHDRNDSPQWRSVVSTGEWSSRCGRGGVTDELNLEASCGRPLGLLMVKRATVDPDYYRKGNEDALLVADGRGLLLVTDIFGRGAVRTLAMRATHGEPADDPAYRFQLLNALAQDPRTGDVYITETSTHFPRRRIFHAALDGRKTGRLLRYRLVAGQPELQPVATGLFLPNGIVLSHDGARLLLVCGLSILSFDLARQQIDPQPFVAALPGTGDNIKAMPYLPTHHDTHHRTSSFWPNLKSKTTPCYWLALGSKYSTPFSLLKFLSDKPLLRSFLLAIVPYNYLVELIPKWTALASYDTEGNLIQLLRDGYPHKHPQSNTLMPWLSEAEPFQNYLYFASWYNPFLARIKPSHLTYN